MNIAIAGAGSWGIALAAMLHKRGHRIRMWEFNSVDAAMLHDKREHSLKLPGIKLADDIIISNNLSQTLTDAQIVVLVVPSQTMRTTVQAMAAQISPQNLAQVKGWVIATKGVEVGTLKLMNEIVYEELSASHGKIAVLSGPSHAEEVSRGVPTSIVAASENIELATLVQNEFSTETFRMYTNNDVSGVELAASTKNIIAIAAGICDGLGFGDNTKGALLTRGIVEMVRLGRKMGAQEETFYGLAGLGDLVTTAISRHSRNRRVGEFIGSGLTLEQALAKMVMVAEGVETCRSVHALAQKLGIEMPITAQVYAALFEGKSPLAAVRDLMMRSWKPERVNE